jgi:hypothetical protein
VRRRRRRRGDGNRARQLHGEEGEAQEEWLQASEASGAQAILKIPDVFTDPFAHVSTSTGNLVTRYKSGLIAKMEEGVSMVHAERNELAYNAVECHHNVLRTHDVVY